VLHGQLGCFEIEADAEVPSAFGHELDWLICNSLPAQRIVSYQLLSFAINVYCNVIVCLAQLDFEVDIGIVAVFEAEFRLPSSGSFPMLVFTV